MPKIDFTPDELKLYFDKRREYHYAARARKLETDMRVHADGIYPEELINERRPNEAQIVHDYRKKIFIAKTKPFFSKIESTLQKIRRSSDWNIKYGPESFDKIVDGEKLNDYTDIKYPVFESITNWAFSLLLRNYLIDANAILVVAPMEIPEEDNVYLKPVATIFNSSDVLDFAEDDYVILRNKVGAVYFSNGKPMMGESYYVITTKAIHRHDQINGRRQFAETFTHEHGLEELPAFKLGGIVIDVYGNNSLYESRISGILPEFNEALREYSDLQAAVVLHMFPKMWEFTQNECTTCKGTGQVRGMVNNEACNVTCETCQGGGYIASGPYSKILVKPAAADQLQVPTPPIGYPNLPTEIIELQQKSVQDHIYYALSAINFEFLASTPLNQSGTAKEVDKDELNNTVHAVAEDLIKIMDKVYYYTALYRYSAQYTKEQIIEMLPHVAVPEKFDILSTKYFDEQITSAINNKLNPAIINAMQIAYADKAFNNEKEIAEHVSLVLKLDPLSGIGEDDKMSRLSNGGITQLDYIVSSNINKFVNLAIEADPKFIELETTKQREVIYKMAGEQEIEKAKTLIPADELDEDDEKKQGGG